jgi:hypothetical protein
MSVSLAEFIETHGKAIGEKIEQELTPVYNSDKSDAITESFDEKIDSLLRAPCRRLLKIPSRPPFSKRDYNETRQQRL